MTEATTANIAEGLAEHVVPIDVPVLHPENPRRGDVAAIAESLSRFGQIRPIVVQKSTAYVIAGNHTLRAAQELGWQEIAAVVIDIDDDEALAYLVADNRLADRGEYDDVALNKILELLMLAGRLGGTGYSPDDVDDRLAMADALPTGDPEPTEGTHGTTDEALAERFKNRSSGGALRQFVLLYETAIGVEVEGMLVKLARAWGVSGARDVVLEALRRASAEPPVEGLTPEEAERAHAPLPEAEPTAEGTSNADEPAEPTVEATGAGAPAPAASGGSEVDRRTPLERAGIVDPPGPETPPQPVTRTEQEEQERTQLIDPPARYPN